MAEQQSQECIKLSQTPSGAISLVKQLRKNPNDKQLLNTLTNIVADPDCWEHLRDADILDLFIDLTLNRIDRNKDEQDPFPSWLLPLQGLFNFMVGVRRSSGGFENKQNREKMIQYLTICPQICDLLYNDGFHICRSEEHAEHIRRTLVSWIQAIWNGTAMVGLAQIKNRLKESHIIAISTWCWLFTTTSQLRSIATLSLSDILEQPITSKNDLEEVITACGSSERLVEAINHILSDENVLDESLTYCMGLSIAFTGQTIRPELIQMFGTLNTTKHVMGALRRQIRYAEQTENTWRIITYSGMLLVNIVNDSKSPTEELTNLISNYSLVPLLAGVLLRIAQASKSGETWLSLVALLKHTCTCTSKSCRIRTSPEYVSALRTHLQWRWWSTLKKLYTTAPKSEVSSKKKIMDEWLLLGRVAGLKEEEEKQRHEEKGVGIKGCWYANCLDLVQQDPDPSCDHPPPPITTISAPSLRKCSGCKKAMYCSTACQSKLEGTQKSVYGLEDRQLR
ncbi:hypothetical protein Clacol_009189 [Clathrus columnatus]|uniref:MYND-type domain-containing protein n=1 Tax=Clathrus columnatus TaxID=1419009 RepID=A0AAV5AQD6_9AGAM|nr:hypothetical protein Clacol_009189 [Clathrus columnatus]